METSPDAVKTMPGRDVLALAIRAFDARAEYGRSVGMAYGEAAIGAGLQRNIELDNATATILRVLAARAAGKVDDLPKDKEGKPRFVDKLRHEITSEIVQLFAGAYRAAYGRVSVEPDLEKVDAA